MVHAIPFASSPFPTCWFPIESRHADCFALMIFVGDPWQPHGFESSLFQLKDAWNKPLGHCFHHSVKLWTSIEEVDKHIGNSWSLIIVWPFRQRSKRPWHQHISGTRKSDRKVCDKQPLVTRFAYPSGHEVCTLTPCRIHQEFFASSAGTDVW